MFLWDLGVLPVSWAGSGHVEGLGDTPGSAPKGAAPPGPHGPLLAMCCHPLMLSQELS